MQHSRADRCVPVQWWRAAAVSSSTVIRSYVTCAVLRRLQADLQTCHGSYTAEQSCNAAVDQVSSLIAGAAAAVGAAAAWQVHNGQARDVHVLWVSFCRRYRAANGEDHTAAGACST